jgi:hypothetical protein
VAVPPSPVTVNVYVFVDVRLLTNFELFTATAPIPWSMLADDALLDVQVSVELPPLWTEVGFALMVHTGFEGGTTVTVVEHCAEPSGPYTVMRYVVVTDGSTYCVPFKPTAPMPLIVADVALEELHERVKPFPDA